MSDESVSRSEESVSGIDESVSRSEESVSRSEESVSRSEESVSETDGESGSSTPDGGRSSSPSTHTVRLELVDEPGQLLAALEPIGDNGGNLLSIHHERGNKTPRGRVPVEVDFAATDDRFEAIVDALRAGDVHVMQAGTEEYAERLTILLFGQLVDTDLSDTLTRIEACAAASVADVSLAAARGTDAASSARLQLETRAGEAATVLATVRSIAEEKRLRVVEPLDGVTA